MPNTHHKANRNAPILYEIQHTERCGFTFLRRKNGRLRRDASVDLEHFLSVIEYVETNKTDSGYKGYPLLRKVRDCKNGQTWLWVKRLSDFPDYEIKMFYPYGDGRILSGVDILMRELRYLTARWK